MGPISFVFAVAIMSVCMRQLLTPNRRGFFLNDESISHPYRPSSVPDYMLYTIGFLVPVSVVSQNFHKPQVRTRRSLESSKSPFWLAHT